MKNNHLNYYTPFFCEENCWQLVNSFSSQKLDNSMILILSNEYQSIALANQLPAKPNSFIVWDYHVVIYSQVESLVYDLGSRLEIPSPVSSYYQLTFTDQSFMPEEYKTYVRNISASYFTKNFHSDRSHMMNDQGRPVKPFPSWPLIEKGNLTLNKILDFDYCDENLVPFIPVSDFFDEI